MNIKSEIFKKKAKVYFYLLLFFSLNSSSSNNIKYKLNIQEIEPDSILHKKIDSIRLNLNKNNFQYSNSLRLALLIGEEVKKSEDSKLHFKSNLLLGDIYSRTNNYKESLNYFKQAFKFIPEQYNVEFENNQYFDYATILLRLGVAYRRNGFNDSALYYYKKVENLNVLDKRTLRLKAAAFNNISNMLQRDSLFTEAESYSRKTIKIRKELGDKISLSKAYNNLASLYLSQGLYKKSKSIYEEGIRIIKNDNSEMAIRSKADLYYNLAWAMRNLKEYKAYDALEDSYDLSDKIRDINLKQVIEEVRQKHNVDMVRQEARVNAATASRKTWIITISGISVILILLFVLVSYNLRQKNLQLTLVQKETEQKRKLSQLHAESQALILNAALDGKESERKEIAETLHDNVSTLLSSANLHLQACKTQFNGNTPIEVDKTQIIINEASQKIRDLSHTLVSSILLKFGLSFAVTDLTKKYSNSQLEFNGDIQKLDRYNQKFEIKVYNIIQELVNNILKHSKATKASIHLSENNKRLHILIKDNGKGFDKTKITVKDGLGINQIDARIKMMNGKFEIDSKKNKGTTILIELPILEVIETKNA